MDVTIDAEGIGVVETYGLSIYAATPGETESVFFLVEELPQEIIQVVMELTTDIRDKTLKLRDVLLNTSVQECQP
jgi:hypothetical protein